MVLSGVPGLHTCTMVSKGVLESTSGLPSLVHVRLGCGFPDPLHVSVKWLPSTTMAVVFEISTLGATETKFK